MSFVVACVRYIFSQSSLLSLKGVSLNDNPRLTEACMPPPPCFALQVDFLKKAELREYELERDKRLAGDVRLRNRL